MEMDINKIAREQLITVGLNVQYYRKKKNLSQLELSELTDMHVSAISKLENANRYNNSQLLTLLKIAIALNISPSKLLHFRDEEEIIRKN